MNINTGITAATMFLDMFLPPFGLLAVIESVHAPQDSDPSSVQAVSIDGTRDRRRHLTGSHAWPSTKPIEYHTLSPCSSGRLLP